MNVSHWQFSKHFNRIIFTIVIAGAAWVTLLCWAFPMSVTCILGFLAALLFFYAGPAKGALSVIMLIILTSAANFAVKLPPIISLLYVSPFEALNHYDHAENFVRYERNATMKMRLPFGNLHIFSPGNPYIAKVPKDVTWETDSLGFRNSRDFQRGDWILIGASNIMGAGMDQGQTITSQLTKRGCPSYNLAGPGSLKNYISYLNFARENLDCSQSPAIVFFSDLDFSGLNSPPKQLSPKVGSVQNTKTESILKRSLRPVKNRFGLTKLSFYRACFLLRTGITAHQLINTPISPDTGLVTTGNFQGIPIAFLNGQAQSACRTAMPPESPIRKRAMESWSNALSSMQPHLQLIVFIPEKFRIYQPFLEPAESSNLALPLTRANQCFLQEVCDSLDLPLLDLTSSFSQAAKEAIKNNQLLYWADDTHWNGNGVSVAASHVSAFMKSSAGMPSPPNSK